MSAEYGRSLPVTITESGLGSVEGNPTPDVFYISFVTKSSQKTSICISPKQASELRDHLNELAVKWPGLIN